MTSIAALHGYITPLLVPTHPYVPFGLIDLYGASRLSVVIDWIASGVFDPPALTDNDGQKGKKKKGKSVVKPRASLLQEVFGLMVVVFGGETFLSMSIIDHPNIEITLTTGLCTGQPPSWLLSPKVAILFGGIRK